MKSGGAVLRFLHHEYPQQEHAASLLQSRAQILAVVRGRGLHELGNVKPLHVAAYIEGSQAELSKPTVKQHAVS